LFVTPKVGIYDNHMNQNFQAYLGNGSGSGHPVARQGRISRARFGHRAAAICPIRESAGCRPELDQRLHPD